MQNLVRWEYYESFGCSDLGGHVTILRLSPRCEVLHDEVNDYI